MVWPPPRYTGNSPEADPGIFEKMSGADSRNLRPITEQGSFVDGVSRSLGRVDGLCRSLWSSVMARRAEARRDLQLAWRRPFVLSGVRAGMTSDPSSSVLLPLSMLLD